MTTQLAVIDEVRGNLTKMQPQFKLALPPHVPPEKFVRVLMTAVQATPKLLEADRQSLYQAAMKSAADGLLCDGREAALVTFGSTVQYMPMIAGILKKIRNSGELESVSAQVVYENDVFDFQLGDNEGITHKWPALGVERGKPIGAYAIAHIKGGGIYREVMTEAQIQAVRNVSRAKDSGPWNGPFADEMRRKTVLRRLAKRLPMSTDLESVMQADDPMFMPPEQPAPVVEKTVVSEPDPAPTGKTRRPRNLEKVVEPAPAADPFDGATSGHEDII